MSHLRKTPIAKRKRALAIIIIAALLTIGGSASFMPGTGPAIAQTENPYLVRTFVDEQGRQIDEIIVPGRPPEIKAPVAAVPEPYPAMGINTLSNVPAFDWSYGCSATSAAMMAGYYDNHNYTNMYAGPTNGGVCPMNNSVWGPGINGSAAECPLSATHQGKDGLTTKGHVDDYWSSFGSIIDPYYGNWAEHTYADCTADYMGTNQYHNCQSTDGGTWFYFWPDGSPLYDYTGCEPAGYRDGCHGVRLFVESRGYSVFHDGINYQNYNQYIYGYDGNTLGFNFSDFQSEIDAGRPVLIQVEGHTMLGYGYNTTGQVIYIHNTWDYSDHSMPWGGTYSGRQHYGVTVIQLDSPTAPSVTTNDASGITDNSATLNGNLDNLGTAPTVNVSFEWGKTVSYGNTTTPESKNTTGAFSFALGSLSPNTTYHFRVEAIGDGTSYGSDKSFCTLFFPVHNINTGENFSTIQAAINAVNTTNGDTITVDAGTYNENVDVTKQLTIRSTSGNPVDTIVNATNPNDHVFNVTADWVNITEFTVQNATGDNATGIYLYGANHCNISNNVIRGNSVGGIYLNATHNSILDNNTVSHSLAGIGLENSTYNNVTSNNVSNTSYAVAVWRSSHFNKVINNTIFNTTNFVPSPSGNYSFAIEIMGSSNNTVDNNHVFNTTAYGTNASAVGIFIMPYNGPVDSNTITNNEIYNTTACGMNASAMGISVMGGPADNNMITNNELCNATASGSGYTAGFGIYVMNATDNKLLNNTVSSNDFGIILNSSSNNNTIYNNYFDNTNNAWDNGTNTWNTTKTSGTNIIGGPYLGGNYWSDYSGNDTDKDGLGDTPYNIGGSSSSKDHLPLLVVTGATLEGQVDLFRKETAGDPTWVTLLVVRFFDNSTKVEMGWSPINVTTDAYGNFAIVGIVSGTYDIGIKNYTTLSKMAYGKNFTAGSVTLINFGTLIEADCDDSDKTDCSDYSRVLNNYNVWKIADPTFWATYDLWKADYNRDKKIDASDYSAVLNNYGGRGDIFYYTH